MKEQAKYDVLYNVMKILIIAILFIIAFFTYLVLKKDEKQEFAMTNEVDEIVVQNIIVEDTRKEEKIEQNIEKIQIPLIKEEQLPIQPIKTTVTIYNNRFYYNQLDYISKEIYDEIEKNIENMKSGTYRITLPNKVTDIIKNDDDIEQLEQYMQATWDALGSDRVDIFFIDISKITTRITKTTKGNNVSYKAEMCPTGANYLYSEIGDEQTVESMFENINNVCANIIATTSDDEYEQVLKVHDWLVNNLQYNTKQTSISDYNLYGAIVEKTAVCEGYAEAFKYILDALKIPCVLIRGEATNSEGETEKHEWNYVELNGKWYAVDATWDDPVVKGANRVQNNLRYTYFLKGSQTMERNHKTIGTVTENGKEFKYPELELYDY